MQSIDLNCDLGEGTGPAAEASDAQLFPLISSANIACGYHAGDVQSMRRSVSLALQHGVAIGAHPGTLDREGFGRRPMELSPEEVEKALIQQINTLDSLAREIGGEIRHIKPHGWLYNEASQNAALAKVMAKTIKSLNPRWILFGAAGSQLIAAARDAQLPYAEEAFADRSYESDGSLSPRSKPGSLLVDPDQAVQQCLSIILNGKVRTTEGSDQALHADTICIHGDNPSALPILKRIREIFSEHGIQIHPPKGV
ncbi:MAG: 5-oxoprolinase subunit PxpA [Terriglobia bacterium]